MLLIGNLWYRNLIYDAWWPKVFTIILWIIEFPLHFPPCSVQISKFLGRSKIGNVYTTMCVDVFPPTDLRQKEDTTFREATKKVFFLLVRPLRLSNPLELSGHIFFGFFSSFKKKKIFLVVRPYPSPSSRPLLVAVPLKNIFFAASIMHIAASSSSK